MPDDQSDRDLSQRLRAYESRIPDAAPPPPSPGIVARRFSWVRLDPAAATCTGTANYPEATAPSRAEAVAPCRTEFVVESLTPIP